MTIALLVVTDGRDEYLNRCTESMCPALTYAPNGGGITERFMFDDTGSTPYRADLARRYPQFEHINAGPRQGFGGAIRAAWAHLAAHSQARLILHVEADFVFRRPVDLAAMAAVLDANPHLAQMALRRQAWNDQERAAGGVVEQHPDSYTEHTDGHGNTWLEHRLFMTTNPCLYRRSLCSGIVEWPDAPRSEGLFGLALLRYGTPEASPDDVRFGFWGSRDSGEWVEHIGDVRAGVGY